MTLTAMRADWYDDDPDYNYLRYWDARGYEHGAEVLAIRRLLHGLAVGRAADVGGGYGRLSGLLREYAEQVVLIEPSRHQRQLADDFLADISGVVCQAGDAARLPFPDASVELILVARVLHHIPDPLPALRELARVLTGDGTVVLEFANSANALRRVRAAAGGRRVPRTPINPPSHVVGGDAERIPFVNHHPAAIRAAVADAGFTVERVLSVSNLRMDLLKRALPLPVLLRAERLLQPGLAPFWFGPSVWLRLHRR
ncbi:MAG: class I SAM-dependent methyltransferase [Mycobacteriales bacterium]